MAMIDPDREIVVSANALARRFYQLHGYVVAEGYRFDLATHPQERLMWQLAVEAFDHVDGTDVINALAAMEE